MGFLKMGLTWEGATSLSNAWCFTGSVTHEVLSSVFTGIGRSISTSLHTHCVSAEQRSALVCGCTLQSKTHETIFLFKAAVHASKHLGGGGMGQNKSPSCLPRPAHTRVLAAGALGTLSQVKPDDLFGDAAHK